MKSYHRGFFFFQCLNPGRSTSVLETFQTFYALDPSPLMTQNAARGRSGDLPYKMPAFRDLLASPFSTTVLNQYCSSQLGAARDSGFQE